MPEQIRVLNKDNAISLKCASYRSDHDKVHAHTSQWHSQCAVRFTSHEYYMYVAHHGVRTVIGGFTPHAYSSLCLTVPCQLRVLGSRIMHA